MFDIYVVIFLTMSVGIAFFSLSNVATSEAHAEGLFSLAKPGVQSPNNEAKPQYLPLENAVLIHKATGQVYPLKVEVARRRVELEKGLMFRPKLADDAGMLFLFPEPSPHAMWMKNTPAALDMIFLDCNGLVVDFILNAVANSEEVRHSDVVSCAALELSAGSVARKKLALGDVLRHPVFPRKMNGAGL